MYGVLSMSAQKEFTAIRIVYYPEDKPKNPVEWFILSFQHILIMFGATVAAPLIIGDALVMDPLSKGYFVSYVWMTMGIATILMATFGSKMPFIEGSSFSYIIPITSIGNLYKASVGYFGMPAVAVGLIGGGIFEFLVGFSRLAGIIRPYVTPIIIMPVIVTIGLSLVFYAALLTAKAPWLAVLTIAIVFFLAHFTKGFPSYTSVFWAAVIGYIIGAAAGLVDWTPVFEAEWFRPPTLFPWGGYAAWHLFVPATIGILPGVIASIIETIGDVFTLAIFTGTRYHRWLWNRTIASEGLGVMAGGLLGGIAPTTYTENIGAVALTGVASRYVTLGAGVIAFFLGMIPKFGAVIAAMPGAVLGGIVFITFGLIAMGGIKNLEIIPLTARNMMIMGTALTLGLGVPQVIDVYGPQYKEMLLNAGTAGQTVYILLTTPMAVAFFSAALLDYLIPGTREERGIAYMEELKKLEVYAPISF